MDFFQSPEVVRFEYTNEILVRENPDYWSKIALFFKNNNNNEQDADAQKSRN